MPDNGVEFDESSATRIAKVVRTVESNSGEFRYNKPITNSPGILTPKAVMIVGYRDAGNGFFPGKFVFFNRNFHTCNSTTSTTGTTTSHTTTSTSSTTTTSHTTTTPRPTTTTTNRPFLNFSETPAQDCWVMLKATDDSEIEVGDVYDGTVVNDLAQEGGLPVVLVSYAYRLTCPADHDECTGRGKWSYNTTTRRWDLSDSTCSAGCVPDEPQFCGPNSLACGIALTPCVVAGTQLLQPNCTCYNTTSTTTTTGTGTTTTTTAGPTTTTTFSPRCSGCDWYYVPGVGLRQTSINCNYGPHCSNSCETPTGPFDDCEPIHTDCDPPTTTTTPRPCQGGCDFIATGADWIPIRNNCAGACANTPCACIYPTQEPTLCGQTASTNCHCTGTGMAGGTTTTANPGGSGTTTTPACTTTTVYPGCDSGQCIHRWSADLEDWIYVEKNCAYSCTCPAPYGVGSYDCELQFSICEGTTTTSTTTTTTTGTTTPNPCECGYYCTGDGVSIYQWSPYQSNCVDSGCAHECCPVPTDPCNAFNYGEIRYPLTCVGCGSTTSTTTTTGTTTSTTPAPCEVGINCFWYCAPAGTEEELCGVTSCQLLHVSGSDWPYGVVCGTGHSTEAGCISGEGSDAGCSGSTTTTTVTTTTTTTTVTTTTTAGACTGTCHYTCDMLMFLNDGDDCSVGCAPCEMFLGACMPGETTSVPCTV